MKSKILSLAALLVAMILPSCNESWQPDIEEKTGSVSLASMAVEVDRAEKVIDEQSRAGVDISSFIVTIRNSKGVVKGEWTVAKMPEIITLPVGTYTVDVVSHQIQKAEWEKPYFKGSQTFSVEDSQITDIGTVVCQFSSIKVTIKYTDKLFKQLGDDVKVTVVYNNESVLVFDKDEERSGYFEAIEDGTTMVATLTGTVCGCPENTFITVTDVKGGQHHIITFRIKDHNPEKPDETGGMQPGFNIDATVVTDDINNDVPPQEDVIPGERPGQEEPLPDDPNKPDNPDNPDDNESEITVTSNDFDVNAVNTPTDGAKYIVNIHSKIGLAHLIVKIESEKLTREFLQGVGLTDEFDLAYPGDLEAALGEGEGGFGFPVGEKVIGQTDVVFNITDFVPLLGIYSGEHKFILTVQDEKGFSKVQTLTFKVD